MLSEKQLIKKCKRYNLKAQKELYERYAPTFKCICMRYIKPETDADDVLQEGFLKIFKYIKQFKGEGSFEGWMKRIIVNTALYYCKKKTALKEDFSVDDRDTIAVENNEELEENSKIDRNDIDETTINYDLIEKAEFSKQELIDALDVLKDDFKIVCSLYFFEGYKHADIAEMLDIDEKTSRSRLSRAKKMLQDELYKRSITKMTL